MLPNATCIPGVGTLAGLIISGYNISSLTCLAFVGYSALVHFLLIPIVDSSSYASGISANMPKHGNGDLLQLGHCEE